MTVLESGAGAADNVADTTHAAWNTAPSAVDLTHSTLLGRDDLVRRWQHGSPSFFWRAEQDGLLLPCTHGVTLAYTWPEIFKFEGGPPPTGMDPAYRQDLMTPEQAVAHCPFKADTLVERARRGELPARRIGRVYRFVPAEVAAWLARWRANEYRRLNGRSRKITPSQPDE